MSSSGQKPDLGAWSGDDQEATVLAAWEALPDSTDEGSDVLRAIRLFSRTIMLRAHNNAKAIGGQEPVILLLREDWRSLGKENGWTFVPQFADGSVELTGHLFVAPPGLGAAYSTRLPSAAIGDIFHWIEDQLKLGDAVAMLSNPSATEPELRVYREGMAKAERHVDYPLYLAELELQALDKLLARFWDAVVCAPTRDRKCEPLWKNAAKFLPVSGPEKIIQRELFKWLKATLPGLHIAEEEETSLGRLDIRISGPAGNSSFVNHAVIELKVFQKGNSKPPFQDAKMVRDQVSKGAKQAASYRIGSFQARIAALACYDMRVMAAKRADSCFLHIVAFAKQHKIELRRWPLLPSAEALRDFRTAS